MSWEENMNILEKAHWLTFMPQAPLTLRRGKLRLMGAAGHLPSIHFLPLSFPASFTVEVTRRAIEAEEILWCGFWKISWKADSTSETNLDPCTSHFLAELVDPMPT